MVVNQEGLDVVIKTVPSQNSCPCVMWWVVGSDQINSQQQIKTSSFTKCCALCGLISSPPLDLAANPCHLTCSRKIYKVCAFNHPQEWYLQCL